MIKLERVPLNTTIRKDLKKKLQVDAVTQEKGMNDILEELLEEYYNSKEKSTEKGE